MGGSLRQWRWGGGQRGERSRRAGGALLGLHRPAVAAATPAAPRGWSGEAKVPAGVCPPLQGVVTREVAPDAWRDLYTRVGVPREVGGDGTGRDDLLEPAEASLEVGGLVLSGRTLADVMDPGCREGSWVS